MEATVRWTGLEDFSLRAALPKKSDFFATGGIRQICLILLVWER
jgi:hypothetical protein